MNKLIKHIVIAIVVYFAIVIPIGSLKSDPDIHWWLVENLSVNWQGWLLLVALVPTIAYLAIFARKDLKD